jgi:hydroxymethylbilane synthase
MALLRRSPPRLRLGTRGSRLALIQATMVRDQLVQAHPELKDRVHFVTFSTPGDRDRTQALESLNPAQGGRGVFSDDLDRAILTGEIDLAVHSVKDTPPDLAPGLALTATLERADPREAFVSFRHPRLADVGAHAIFGSASMRRQALLRAIKPDATFTLLRGNVEERLDVLRDSELAGTILAVAGLVRLGRAHAIAEILEPEQLMPDPGQGAIGIVCAASNLRLRRLLSAVDHAPTHAAVDAERAALAAIGASLPVGALAQLRGGHLVLDAVLAPANGGPLVRGRIDGPQSHAESLGRVLGLQLKTGLDLRDAA